MYKQSKGKKIKHTFAECKAVKIKMDKNNVLLWTRTMYFFGLAKLSVKLLFVLKRDIKSIWFLSDRFTLYVHESSAFIKMS